MTAHIKRYLLKNSLKNQLSLMIKNLDDFGLALNQIRQFLHNAIFSYENHQNPEELQEKPFAKQQETKISKQNLTITNLADFLINQIQSKYISNKSLLKCLHNIYATNSTLNHESFVSLSSGIQKKSETEEKLEHFWKKVSKNQKKVTQVIKTSQETLSHRRSQRFERDSIFRRQQTSEEHEEQFDIYSEQALEFESSQLNSRIKSLASIQEELDRVKEIQKKCQKEIEIRMVEKMKLTERLGNAISVEGRHSEFASNLASMLTR